jgi:2-dehydro-3-deoxyphosphooctonate aldolase (KDO 8-P synthase)
MIKCKDFEIGPGNNMLLIAGPCVIEEASLTFDIAAKLKEITAKLDINFVFKASLDKANRTSHESFRGLGNDKGLAILENIKNKLEVPVLTDIHDVASVADIAAVVDVLQIPALLCRQTDLVLAAAATNKIVNIKKGQFLAPWDMKNVLNKALSVGNSNIMLTERGTMFGYNNLVVDMRSLAIMPSFGAPVIFDMTHSVQQPGAGGSVSSGQREFIPPLARAAVACGVDGIFMETHPEPDKALSDGPNSLPLAEVEQLLKQLIAINSCVKSTQTIENDYA